VKHTSQFNKYNDAQFEKTNHFLNYYIAQYIVETLVITVPMCSKPPLPLFEQTLADITQTVY